MRIYLVKTDEKVVRFVRAASQSAAIRAAVSDRYSATVATTEDIVAASKAGTLDVLDAATPAALEAANGKAPTLTDVIDRPQTLGLPHSRMPT